MASYIDPYKSGNKMNKNKKINLVNAFVFISRGLCIDNNNNTNNGRNGSCLTWLATS